MIAIQNQIVEHHRKVDDAAPLAEPIIESRFKHANYSPDVLQARTFSADDDPDGEAVSLIQYYFSEQIRFDQLRDDVANLMARYPNDRNFHARCIESLNIKAKELKERQLEALRKWYPGKQCECSN